MPFVIERNDLAHVSADVIVITANEGLQINGGVGLSVARAAGLAEMQAACDALGGCPTGCAVATPAFALSAQYVVHVVGPVWQGGALGEEEVLRQAYDSALACADECGARSIAMPLVSAHTFGFPVRLSFVIAVEAIKGFLQDHDDTVVRLVLFGDDAMAVGESFYDNIARYIDSHYVEQAQSPRNYPRNLGYENDQPAGGPQLNVLGERVRGDLEYSREPSQQMQAPTDAHSDFSQKEPLPNDGNRRLGVFSRITEAIENAREHVSELRKPPKDKPHDGTCIVRDEREEPLGPYLSAEQFMQIQANEETASWKAGICPHCKTPVSGMKFCPHCGRSVPAWVSAPDATGAFAQIQAPNQEIEYASAEPSAENAWSAPTAMPDVRDEMSCSDWDESFASYPSADFELGSFKLEESAAPMSSAQQAMPPAASQLVPAQRPAGGSLKSWLDQLDAPFSTTLLALIDARGLTDAQVYKRANMSRQLFSKIRSDAGYRPTKKTVLALAIALGLDLGETADLLQRAGFALSHSSKADVIVEYFIVNGNYDIFEINEALYAFDLPLL